MPKENETNYVPMLQYHQLTFLYDALLWLSGLGPKFKHRITELAELDQMLGGTILDVGCGTGTHTKQLAQYFSAAKVIGIDPDNAVIKNLQSETQHPNLEFVAASATELPYPNESIQVVFSTLTFHHLSTDAKVRACAEVYRVLKPGGFFVLTDWGISRVPYLEYLLITEKPELLKDHFAGAVPGYALNVGFVEIKRTRVKPSGIWFYKFKK